jgi:hypothetical protein
MNKIALLHFLLCNCVLSNTDYCHLFYLPWPYRLAFLQQEKFKHQTNKIEPSRLWCAADTADSRAHTAGYCEHLIGSTRRARLPAALQINASLYQCFLLGAVRDSTQHSRYQIEPG